jgi:hypothetical protein
MRGKAQQLAIKARLQIKCGKASTSIGTIIGAVDAPSDSSAIYGIHAGFDHTFGRFVLGAGNLKNILFSIHSD